MLYSNGNSGRLMVKISDFGFRSGKCPDVDENDIPLFTAGYGHAACSVR